MCAWLVSEPLAVDSLASSQPKLAANFSAIQSVLGSSTLSAGITKVAGDILYASDTETIQRLAKASAAGYVLSSDASGQNPSWLRLADGLTTITTLSGLKSAASLGTVGTITSGIWAATFSSTTLGAWVDKSASYAAQQAATDGFVCVRISGGADAAVVGYTDGNANPTTARMQLFTAHGYASSFMMPVKKSDYWKVVVTTGTVDSVYWIPSGA